MLDPLTGAINATIALPIASVIFAELGVSSERLYLVSHDARVIVIALGMPPQIVANGVLQNLPRGSDTSYHQHALSRDESRLYIGLMNGDNRYQRLSDEIWVYDTQSWIPAAILKPTDPAFHLALSADGTQLYTVNPFKHSLSIFDTAASREIGVMRDLGDTPAQIVVPPSR